MNKALSTSSWAGQFDVIKIAFLSKTRTFLSGNKPLNSSVHNTVYNTVCLTAHNIVCVYAYRVLVLYLGNLYSLIIALLDKVNSMSSAVSMESTK